MKKRYNSHRKSGEEFQPIFKRSRSEKYRRRGYGKHARSPDNHARTLAKRSPFKYTSSVADDFATLLKRFAYAAEFTSDIAQEAETLATSYTGAEEAFVTGREDLRKDLIFTIDGEDARDHDDAVSLAVTTKRGSVVYTLGVHISDVSYFIKHGSVLDDEACRRGTSVYVPGHVLPMFPEAISNNICSLNENATRLTVSGEFVLDSDGNIKQARFFRSVIKSRHRLTYPAVQAVLAGKSSLGTELDHTLKHMETLSRVLLAKRLRAGALDLETREQTFAMEDDAVREVFLKERLTSERIIEEFMLVMNKEAATLLAKHDLGIFREHDAPDDARIEKLKRLLAGGNVPQSTKGSENPLLEQSEHYNRFYLTLAAVTEASKREVVSQWILLTMKQAQYACDSEGHYGLGFLRYTHFTSPIRRYPDLLAHRLLLHYCDPSAHAQPGSKSQSKHPLKPPLKKPQPKSQSESEPQAPLLMTKGELQELARLSNVNERKAVDCEREYKKIKTIRYLNALAENKPMEAYITGIHPRGHVYARDKHTGVEGMIHKSYFYEEFTLDPTQERLRSRDGRHDYGLGSTLLVKVERAEPAKLMIFLSLVTDSA